MEKRIGYIDGMKGIGAVLVVLCHLACAFVPALYYPYLNSNFETIWHGTPLNVLTNGNAAVQMFFLLSGYMITKKNYVRMKGNFDGGIRLILHRIKTLLKITIPAITLSFILMNLGLYFHLETLELSKIFKFLKDFCDFVPTFKNFIIDHLMVLISGSAYVGPLWTMRYELLGSVCVLITNTYAFSYTQAMYRKWVYFLVALLFMHIDPNLVAFFIGAFVWELLHTLEENDKFNNCIRKLVNSRLGRILLSLIGIYCASIPMEGYYGIYLPLGRIDGIMEIIPSVAIRSFGLGIVLLVILKTVSLQKLLSIRPLQFLGKYSAYIYAFHWQIILSAGCFICVSLYNKISFSLLIVIISISCIILTVISAVLYVKIYDIIKERVLKKAIKSKS